MALPTAGTGGEQDQFWPMPKFYFSVDIDDLTDLPFLEVSGLEVEADNISYRHGNDPSFGTIQMPGVKKSGNLILKKGVFANEDLYQSLISKIALNTYKRMTVVIRLLDENAEPRITWQINNAFPLKYSSTDMNSESSEAAIESIEFSHQGIQQV
jgi:phage tail-like protein|tara:strand:- start:23320 stop:23784 length:465 start_codon:yes stop_codon:yes gene_type:complete